MGGKKAKKAAKNQAWQQQQAEAAAQAKADAERKRQEIQMRNEQQLAEANSIEDVVQVEQGGTDVPDTLQEEEKRRKKGASAVSNQLGIV